MFSRYLVTPAAARALLIASALSLAGCPLALSDGFELMTEDAGVDRTAKADQAPGARSAPAADASSGNLPTAADGTEENDEESGEAQQSEEEEQKNDEEEEQKDGPGSSHPPRAPRGVD
jgi:hypothetical protein